MVSSVNGKYKAENCRRVVIILISIFYHNAEAAVAVSVIVGKRSQLLTIMDNFFFPSSLSEGFFAVLIAFTKVQRIVVSVFFL